MALGLRAYYEQENNFGVTDRIEVQVEGFAGTALELGAHSNAFTFRHDEVTGDSEEGLLSIFKNRIQIGKLDFRPRIHSTAERTFLEEIADEEYTNVVLIWKRDGAEYWRGIVDLKKLSYPESGASFVTNIRATDLEYLKSQDYKPSGSLPDANQTIIETIAELLAYSTIDLNIVTTTSWINANTTDATDFLSQIYIDTFALREYAATGDETDQAISVWEALQKVAAPALIIKQINGQWYVEQISAFDSPSAVYQTDYDSAGAVVTATRTVDRRQTGYTSADSGTPSIKASSFNNSFPAVKRAKARFNHRTNVGLLTIPSSVFLTTSNETFQEAFISNGNQTIEMSFNLTLRSLTDVTDGYADVRIRVGQYYWDGSSWTTTSSDVVRTTVTGGSIQDSEGNYIYTGTSGLISTSEIPSDANSPMEITFFTGVIEASPDEAADETEFTNISFTIESPGDDEANSTSIEFQLTQSGGFIETIELDETIYGDGPSVSSNAAYRYSTATNDITGNDWGYRGGSTDKKFHEQYLKEVLNLQRSRTRKLESEIWGEYQPYSILVYDSQNFYYAGGKYSGGRWEPKLMRVNFQTGTDTFEEILKFDSSQGTTGSSGSSGGSGVEELNDLSDVSLLGVASGDFLAYDGSNFTNREIAATDITSGTFADARISQSSVTQYEGNLALSATQITSGTLAIARGGTGVTSYDALLTALTLNTDQIPTFAGANLTGYIELDEITVPSAPALDALRIYAQTEAGFPTLHFIGDDGSDWELSRDTVHVARNNTGFTITKGTPVYINGANGNYPTIAEADASDANKLPVFGVAAEDISNNSFGQVLEQGDLTNIDLSIYSQGQKLYLATGGGLTISAPSGDDAIVVVGTVIKNTAAGILEVEGEGVRDYIEPTQNAEFNDLTINGATILAGVTLSGILDMGGNDIQNVGTIGGDTVNFTSVAQGGNSVLDSTSGIGDLIDVLSSGELDGHVLIYDGVTDNRYENRALTYGDISGSLAFSDLSGSIADAQVPISAVTQHEGELEINVSTQVVGTLPTNRGGTGSSVIATARQNLGLEIGVDVQAYNAALDTYASNSLTASELQQLQNIGTTVISPTKWTQIALIDQDLSTSSGTPLFQSLALATDLAVIYGGTGASTASGARTNLGVEIGVDVQAYSSTLDDYIANALTASELQQLQNIGANTIGGTQWARVANMQSVSTNSSVEFNDIDGINLTMTGVAIIAQSASERTSNLAVAGGGSNNTAEFGNSHNVMTISHNAWGQSSAIAWGLYHNDTGDNNVFNHLYYNTDGGTNNAGGVAIGVNLNSYGAFEVYTAPSSTGAGALASMTRLLRLPHSGDVELDSNSEINLNANTNVTGNISATQGDFSSRIDAVGTLQVTGTGTTTIYSEWTGTGGPHTARLVARSSDATLFLDAINGDISGSDYVQIAQLSDGTFRLRQNNSAGTEFLQGATQVLTLNSSFDVEIPNGGLTVGAASIFKGTVTIQNGETASDSVDFTYYGMEVVRSVGYIRPTTDNSRTLNIGDSSHTWSNINFNHTNDINFSGGLDITGVSSAADHDDSSDRRIKSNFENIEALPFARRAYKNLWSYNKEGMERRQIGLMAQDLLDIHPDIVGTMAHHELGEIYTLSGYTLGSIALAGVGQNDARISQLEREIEALTTELNNLKYN